MSDLRKKVFTKVKILILLVAMNISMFSFIAVHASNVSFGLTPSKSVVKQGEKVTVTAKTKDLAQLSGGFSGYEGVLEYDSKVLNLNEAKSAINSWMVSHNPSNNKFLGNNPMAMDFKTTDTDVVKFEFTVLDTAPAGKTTVRLKNLKLSDISYKGVNLANTSVDITIEGKGEEKPVEPDKSSNNKLSSLKPSTGSLSPKFDPNTKDYTMSVDSSTESIKFDTVTQDKGSKIVSGGGSHTLKSGKNTIEIVVEAEDGTRTTYTVVVDKAKAPDNGGNGSGNNGGSDNGNGNNSGNNDGNGSGSGESNSDNNNGNGSGNGNGSSGTGGNNGSSNNINVDNSSSNNFVLDISGLGSLVDKFDPRSSSHTTYVGKTTTSLNPVVVLEDQNAKYEVIGGKDLKYGDNTVKIIVTAENGDVREYDFNVVRSKEENKAGLASLSVGGYAINPGFRPDVNYYTLTVDNATESLGVSAAPSVAGATVNIEGNHSLKPGVNLIKVVVTAGYEQEVYVVEVIREMEIAPANPLPWIISFAALLVAIILIVIIHFKNKMIQINNEQSRDQMMFYMMSQNNQANNGYRERVYERPENSQ